MVIISILRSSIRRGTLSQGHNSPKRWLVLRIVLRGQTVAVLLLAQLHRLKWLPMMQGPLLEYTVLFRSTRLFRTSSS